MTAITAASASAPPRASRAASRSSEPADAGSPFANLLGKGAEREPARGPRADSPARTDRPDKADKAEKADKPEKADRPDKPRKNDTDNEPRAASGEGGGPLPAWLLALRAPDAPLPGSGGGFAGGDAPGLAVKAAAASAAPGTPVSTVLRPATPPATPVVTPPVTTPVTVAGDTVTEPAGEALPALPAAVTEAMPGSADGAALDAAFASLGTGSAPEAVPGAIAAAVNTMVERAPTSSVTTPVEPLPAPPELGTLTDAFGEPLSLDGQDAALRLGERLRWLTESGVHEARMQLHPRELGSIDIRIRIEGQGASLWFGAEHPAARAALESTLPQLRQQLAADGLSLGQATVGDAGSSERGAWQSAGHGTGEDRRDGAQVRAEVRRADGQPAGLEIPMAATGRIARGLVDRYA